LALASLVVAPSSLAQARPASPARAQAQAASPALPQDGDLTLGAGAGTVLVGLTVRPAQPGPNTLLIYVLPVEGPALAADVSVHVAIGGQTVPLEFCSRSCRTGEVTLQGGEHVDLLVDGPSGGAAAFDLPPLPPPDGTSLLQQAQDRMHALQTYRVDEVMGPNAAFGHFQYAYQAPDRMQVDLGSAQTIFVGPLRYSRTEPGAAWQVDNMGASLPVPSFSWDPHDASDTIIATRIVGSEMVDGVPTQALAFFKGAYNTPFWYRLLVDQSGLVRRVEMDGQGHFMLDHYTDFDAPLAIEPPQP
jgi:hypothetical protein